MARKCRSAPDAPEKDTRAYRFPAGDDATRVPASTVPGFRYRIANPPHLRYQNAHAGGVRHPQRSVCWCRRAGNLPGPSSTARHRFGFPDPGGAVHSSSARDWTSGNLDQHGWKPIAADCGVRQALRRCPPRARHGGGDSLCIPGNGAPRHRWISRCRVTLPARHFGVPAFEYGAETSSDALDLWAHREQPVTAGGLWIFQHHPLLGHRCLARTPPVGLAERHLPVGPDEAVIANSTSFAPGGSTKLPALIRSGVAFMHIRFSPPSVNSIRTPGHVEEIIQAPAVTRRTHDYIDGYDL